MDKGLMALMGIEDDSARDEGLMEQRHQSREPTPFSDEDDDMESLDITTPTTKSSKQSRASSLSGSVDTAMTTPVKDRSQERSQDKSDPLGLFDTAMDDSDDEPLLPSTLTRSLNTPATQPSPSNPNYSTPRRNSPGPLSPHLGPAPRASTSSLFGSSGSTVRVTKSPKKPKKSNSMGGGSLFSPTLSPRKLKKSTSAGFMSPTLSPARKPHSQPQTLSQPLQQAQPTPPSTSAFQATSLSPASSLSSSTPAFVLKKAPITFSDDSDSDISSLDGDNIFSRPPKGKPRPVDTEMAPFGGSVSTGGPEFTDKEVGADLVQAQAPKRISEKDRVKLRMEAERLKRSVPVPVPEIVNEKKTMSWLLQEAQNKLKQKQTQPSFGDTDLLPVTRQTPTKKYRTIALDDDSDDETEEQAKWKQDAARALLVAHIPKDQRLRISKDLNSKTISPEKRSEVERILQMTPLSNKIRNMSLVTSTSATNATPVTMDAKGSSSSSALAFLTSPKKSLTSPSKSQKPGTVNNINQFNELMKRQLAKKNLERRKQLEEEAKKSGTWKSPEEHAAEQLRIEEKRRKGLDPDEDEDEEEDPDYDPKGKDTAPAGTADDDEEMAYDSAGESGSGGESAQEDEEEAEGDDEAELDNQDLEASDEESDDEEEEDEEEEPLEEPEEDEDAPVVKAKRAGARKKTVIGDDDEIRVTLVDRSQVKHSDSEQHHADHSDEEGDGDDDVSDLDQDIMEGTQGTQGFGAFFESSYNPNKGNKQEQLAALNRAPSTSPTLDDDSEVTSSIGGALEFLSGGFPSVTPARVKPSQSQSQEAYDGISPIVEDDDEEPGNTLPLSSQFNAFDVLKSATPAVRRRLVQRQAKPSRGPISKHDKSAFIEYEAEEEEDEFMGMGGVDYESENDNDDYDFGDGMVDANNTLDLEDVRNVKALHMKHEQEQHDKEISDLVHGIAAGNLWKRRNGQADDMDIFDEDDINGRFRRKKKLKVSEKFEKLADNPSTAAFARAFEKNIGDDDLIFLSDPEESDHGDTEKSGKSRKKEVVEDEDADMTLGGQDEAEASEEELNTEKRAERLQQARLLRDGKALSEVTTTTTTTTTTTVIKTKTSTVPGEEVSLEDDDGHVDPIDEYKETMRRTKVIRNILDGFDDEVDLASQSLDLPSQRRTLPSTFNLLDRIVDKGPVEDSAASMRTGGDVDVTAIARPRMLARQNSSFLSEERRTQFLSTVGEESRGGNAGNRMVKEVNRRKMAFATSKKTTDGGSSSSSSSSSSVSVTTTTMISPSSSSDTSSGKRVPGKVPRLPSDGSSSRLLSLLSFEEEE
ncbi:MAG: MRC1-like domain-containing protein [Podila humilis]|nr:MAG: MRC1-like domain-containing protein [Podila humilis]